MPSLAEPDLCVRRVACLSFIDLNLSIYYMCTIKLPLRRLNSLKKITYIIVRFQPMNILQNISCIKKT